MAKVRKQRIRYDRIALILVSLVLLILLIWLVFSIIFSSGNKEEVGDDPIDPIVEKTPYEEFYFYDSARHERYETYHELNPELSYDTVVWHVNSNLDKEFYTEITIITDLNTNPILVNKYFALPEDYIPENMVSIGNGKYMNETAYEAFKLMQADALAEGHKLTIISAYRSYSYQKDLYNNYLTRYSQAEVDTFSARPGHSEHQTGLAIDICGNNGDYLKFEGTLEEQWVKEHAYEYGFIVRYGEDIVDLTGYIYEPWHLRYVGKEIALIMKNEGIKTLEEYIIKYVENRGE